MATGDKFVSIQPKRLLGFQDFRERFLDYAKKLVGDVHKTLMGQNGVFGGTPVTIAATGANGFHLTLDALASDAIGHFLKTDAKLAGRTPNPEIAFENNPAAVAQVDRVDVNGTTNGTYRITINGTNCDFVAAGHTATQIRDGLIAAVNGQSVPVTASIFDSDSLNLTADFPGDAFTATVTAPGGNLGHSTVTANVSSTYYVGLHYTERPRGIQINPRTGAPEFVEVEETIGEKAEPNAVTDNGDGTITFRVDSVAQPFGGAVVTHAGRKCLVWKKNPGALATTESAAVEECSVTFAAGENKITTTTRLGQPASATSTTASDYLVLMLGPTVSKSTDLRIQAGYVFIGRIAGKGTGVVPTAFDTSDQHDLTPSAVDLNSVTRLDGHGDLKIRVRADASDVDEKQVEVQDSGGGTVFSVDEDGDVNASGNLSLLGRLGLGGIADALAKLKIYGQDANAIFGGTVLFGDEINAGTVVEAATKARALFGTLKPGTWNKIFEWGTSGTPKLRLFVHGTDSFGVALTYNAGWNATSSKWAKDQTGVRAVSYQFGGAGTEAGFTVRLKFASLNGDWNQTNTPDPASDSYWNVVHMIDPGNADETDSASVFTRSIWLRSLTSLSESIVPRLQALVSLHASADYSAILEGWTGVVGSQRARLWARKAGGWALTVNADYDPASAKWAKDVPGESALMLLLDTATGFQIRTKEKDVNTPWLEASGWGPGGFPGLLLFTTGQTSGKFPELAAFVENWQVLSQGGFADFDLNDVSGARLKVSRGGLEIDKSAKIGGMITQLGSLFFDAANVYAQRVVVNIHSSGANGPTGLFGTKQNTSGLADLKGYFDGSTKDIEQLYNAARDPADRAKYVRDTNSFPSFRKVIKQNDADRLTVKLQVRGPTLSDNWAEALWRDAWSFLMGDTDHATNYDRNELVGNDGRIRFANPGTVSNPSAAVAQANIVCAKNVAKAWLRFRWTAPGPQPVITDGYNVASIACGVGPTLQKYWIVTLAQDIDVTDAGAVILSHNSDSMVAGPMIFRAMTFSLYPGQILIHVWDTSVPGYITPINTLTGLHDFSLVVYGKQS